MARTYVQKLVSRWVLITFDYSNVPRIIKNESVTN